MSILQYAWWLVLILIISAPVVFFRALKKGGVLKKAKLLLSAINLVEMAEHYDRKTPRYRGAPYIHGYLAHRLPN